MWYRFPGLWKYRCEVCWEPLLNEATKRPENAELNEWVAKLADRFGSDVSKWPKLGCGANFRPWAKGASMVVEMMTCEG
eukprot:6330002-Lingulodinium_polyedra.AAC.1